ncbi:MAG: hypothetical protein EA397_01980 [Deltaproteobacteria bacterium]|nr:MAG: hypothetical protein EA397_01980 [Deltaproteobacteria bacterium]
MMSITDPNSDFSEDLLDAHGGFLWWYVDLVDDDGNGCVLIWSFGLPFLPGRESAAVSGRGRTPRERPSLNIAIYRNFRPELYVLQEVDPADARWDRVAGRVHIGASSMQTILSQGQRQLSMRVDCTMPGGQSLTGAVDLSGPGCRLTRSLGEDPNHAWSPLCTAAEGRAQFFVEGRPFLSVKGRAYHDRNGSTRPLRGLGIRHWIWGRSPMGDEERIWYLLWPHRGPAEAWGFEVASDGELRPVEHLEVERSGPRLGIFGMPWHRRITLTQAGRCWLRVEHAHTVDLGFFYGRWIARTVGPDGQRGTGIAEAVRPGRVDRAWNRWLVRMAVHRAHAPNSPFLPLFAGVRRGAASLEVSP